MAQAYTKLEAVNLILRNMGETSVNSLLNPPLDASEALETLEEIATEVQRVGWYFNTEITRLSPTSDGFLYLPTNALHAETYGASKGTNVTVRNGRIYRLEPFNNGFVFTGPLDLKIVYGLEFEELPASARSYVALRAARVHQLRTVGDTVSADDDNRDEQWAKAELEAEQLAAERLSLKKSWSVQSALTNAYAPVILR
jgi:hypothetical protein